MDLVLSLKREYFEDIKSGNKREEYRRCTPYWKKRLKNKDYKNIILTLGYPKREDTEKRLKRKWKKTPWTVKWITHKQFGPDPVCVFAIDVS